MLLVAGLVYACLRFLRDTRGEGIFKGLILFLLVTFAGLYSLASWFALSRIEAILDVIVQTSVIAMIIIFQQELRYALTKLGQTPFSAGHADRTVVDEIVAAVVRLSKNRIGALIALERQHGLRTYVEDGTRIDSPVRGELLDTIFFPGTLLHDGAVIIQGDRLAAAGCLFPLTESAEISKALGTRHRAAIGVTEDTDAVTVVVSEETGTVSVGVGGRLWRDFDNETLKLVLNGLFVQGLPSVEAVFGEEEESDDGRPALSSSGPAKRDRERLSGKGRAPKTVAPDEPGAERPARLMPSPLAMPSGGRGSSAGMEETS